MADEKGTGFSVWTMDDAAAESDNGRVSPEKLETEESKVFSLLFQQCDKEGDGWVDIDVILDYIQKLQFCTPDQEGEEVFQSHDSSASMNYDLQTLKAMLECNCSNNKKIDETTYSHIIGSWVNHVRLNSGNVNQNPVSPPLDLLEATDSSPSLEERNLSYGSYCHNGSRSSDTTGRRGSLRHETEELISKLQFEIKCLDERNRALMRQYEGSEETLKDYQSKNKLLQAQLDEAMTSLVKLRDLEMVNAEINKTLGETSLMNEELLLAKERLNHELEKVKTEYSELEDDLSTTRLERETFSQELKATQTILSRTKEQEKDIRNEMEIRMGESRAQLDGIINDLDVTTLANKELKTALSELEAQLQQTRPKGIFTSTPFRVVNTTLSLQKELEDQEERMSRDSPDISPLKMNGDVSPPPCKEEVRRNWHVESYTSPAIETFKKLMDETDSKIQTKHSLILQDLNDLLLPVPSNCSLHENSSIISLIGSSDLSSMESKLKGTIRTKNQLKKENINLKKDNSDLLTRLEHLEILLAEMEKDTPNGPADFGTVPQWNSRSPGRNHAETSPRIHSPGRTQTETSPRIHSPGRTQTETSPRSYSPRRTPAETSPRSYSPRRTQAETSPHSYSPGRTQAETSLRSRSPAHTQAEIYPRSYSPGHNQTETSLRSRSPGRTQTEIYSRSYSPGRTQTETSSRSRSPVRTQTETYPHSHSPGQIQTETFPRSHSPGRTQTETSPRSRSPGRTQTETSPRSRSPGRTQTETSPRSRSPGRTQTETSPRSRSPGRTQTETSPRSRSPGRTLTETSPRSRSPGRTQTETSPRSRSPGRTQTEISPHSLSPGRTQTETSPRSLSPGHTQTKTSPHSHSLGRTQSETSPRSRSLGRTQTETSPRSYFPGRTQTEISPRSYSPGHTQTETYPHSHFPGRTQTETSLRSYSPGHTQIETYPHSHSPGRTQNETSTRSHSPGSTQAEASTHGLGDSQAQTSTSRSHSPIAIGPLTGGSYKMRSYNSAPVTNANLSVDVRDSGHLKHSDGKTSGGVGTDEEKYVPVNEHVPTPVDTGRDRSRFDESYHFPDGDLDRSFVAFDAVEGLLPLPGVNGKDTRRREVGGGHDGILVDEGATRNESDMDGSPSIRFVVTDVGTELGMPRSRGTKSDTAHPAHDEGRELESTVEGSPPRPKGRSFISMKTGPANVEESGSDLLGKTPLPKSRRQILQEPDQELHVFDEGIGRVVDIRPTYSSHSYSSQPRTPLSASDIWVTDSSVPCTDMEMLGSSPVPRMRHLLRDDPEVSMQDLSVQDLTQSGSAVTTTWQGHDTSPSFLDSNCLSIYGVLKNAVLLLLLIVLIMAFLVLIILSQDAMERCGSYCPHSPVHFLYSTFEPYLQYSKEHTQI